FVADLAPDDRCHLNGLGMVLGRPKYVTCLGATNSNEGWRNNKATGGVVIDIETDEILARGLCMPHSPRFHANRLWVLNSGEGGFGFIDMQTGQYEPVAQLPGFTRGLCFRDEFAFIGLSQVRETAIFSGIPIAEWPTEERWSGVAVVNWTTGETVGFMKFEQDVEEVFSVCSVDAEWPDLITDDESLIAQSYALPEESIPDVPGNFLPCRATTTEWSIEMA
ncbi:MAG: DUF4915 domain-containing protein, partial [Planctomycetaceae bacterium]|nr:DUF4915 domain-containing protein [Planctomycetaceae bacterium]